MLFTLKGMKNQQIWICPRKIPTFIENFAFFTTSVKKCRYYLEKRNSFFISHVNTKKAARHCAPLEQNPFYRMKQNC